jgi:hypothetical protein
MPFLPLGEQPPHVGGLRHVALHGDRLAARRADVGDDLVGRGLARRGIDHDRGAPVTLPSSLPDMFPPG